IINKITKELSSDNVTKLLKLKNKASTMRKAANDAAAKVFKDSPLNGINSESWRVLWEKAKEFSEKVAYKGINFPNTNDDALCVLCQEPLSKQATQRFLSFENYIKSSV